MGHTFINYGTAFEKSYICSIQVLIAWIQHRFFSWSLNESIMTRTLTCLFCIASLFLSLKSFGQGIGLNSTGVAPNPLSIVDMTSTTQGFLIPRMSKSQRVAIAGPASGLLVYQNDTEQGFYHFDGVIWQPWLKQRAGTISMGIAASTVTKGSGFTASHIVEGRDQVVFSNPYLTIPDITLSAEGVPGSAPRVPFDYCFSQLSDCSNVYATFVRLRNGGSSGSPVFMETGQTLCNPASFNYTFYDLSHNAYTSQGPTPTISAGSQIYLQSARSITAASNVNSFNIWFDWNQDGFFGEEPELVLSESGSITTSPGASLNLAITVPIGACNGIISGRLLVRSAPNEQIPCIIEVKGETEDFEIIVGGGVNCTYPDKAVNCNILNPTLSGFTVNCVDKFGDSINGVYNFKVVQ